MVRGWRGTAIAAAGCAFAAAAPLQAQTPAAPAANSPSAAPAGATPAIPGGSPPTASAPIPDQPAPLAQGLALRAVFAPSQPPIRNGLTWRLYRSDRAGDGTHALVAQSTDPNPRFTVPDGTYIVHAAYGLAGATKRVTLAGRGDETLVLNAGGLRITGQLGDGPIPAMRESIAVYVPQPGNAEAKLVLSNARAGDVMGLPEGNYHVVSTYLDTTGPAVASGAAGTPTNSVVTADLRVQAGKLTDATLRHRAATITLKLVNAPGGEALANTSFSVLTPGGDVIRELIGAFPSLVLAEDNYTVIARHDGRTYQIDFQVQSGLDRDVEVLAK